MQCYNLIGELDDDESLEINIPKSEGVHTVKGVYLGINNTYHS